MNFQTAILKPLCSIALASTLLSVAAQHAFAQRATQKIESEGVLTDAELASDPTLSLPLQLTTKSLSVEGALLRLSESSRGEIDFYGSGVVETSKSVAFLREGADIADDARNRLLGTSKLEKKRLRIRTLSDESTDR